MTEHGSFYLDSRQNDFAEFSEIDHSDIPFVDPANDNEPTKARPSDIGFEIGRACQRPCMTMYNVGAACRGGDS